MNVKFFVGILAVLICSVAAGVLWYIFFAPKTSEVPGGTTTTFPVSNSAQAPTQTSGNVVSGPQTIVLTTSDNNELIAKDFIHNGKTIMDTANPGYYLLAGNLGYCLSDPQKCQAAPAENYQIYFIEQSKSFVIDLSDEPLGVARADAERFLLSELGIAESQMCNLNYYVGTTRYANSQLAGKNLGFSFCPGATVLPK